jgi:23S rRNA pseudouridine955/2504/2580 synthase
MTEADTTITVASSDGSLRLDRWFKRHYPGLGHGHLEKLLRTGRIRVDGKRARSSDRVCPGQAIRIPPGGLVLSPRPLRPQPRAADRAMLQTAILHRDEAVIVLDKPPGLAVQGGTGTERHVDGLLDSLRFESPERPRLVHRLDKETSGILVIARTAAAAAFLTLAFREKATRKTYWAVVVGRPKLAQGRIDLALAKMAGHGGERVRPDTGEGRRAVTYYRVIDSAGTQASWLALMPVTGRTHQLRAHCEAIGHPIVGDPKYNRRPPNDPARSDPLRAVPPGLEPKLHLLARRLVLPHPRKGVIDVTAPLPEHIKKSFAMFGFDETERDPIEDAPDA